MTKNSENGKKVYFRSGKWENGVWDDFGKDKYTIPIPRKEPWKGQSTFIKNLIRLEESEDTESNYYKGYSKCRVCGKRNGSAEFCVKEWSWPSGLLHYVKEHNVKPKKDFIEFVNNYGR